MMGTRPESVEQEGLPAPAAVAAAGATGTPSTGRLVRQVVGATTTYGFSSILARALGFALIPVYTRYLSTAEYGIVSVATTVTGLVAVLMAWGLPGAVTRQYYDYSDDPRRMRDYLGTVYIFFAVAGVLLAGGLVAAGGRFGDRLLGGVPFQPYISIAIWTAFLSASSGMVLGLFRARQQPVRYVTLDLTQFVTALLLSLMLVVVFRQGALGPIRGSLIAGALVFFLTAGIVSREASLDFSFAHLRDALAFGLPLVPHLLAGWALNVADRLLLERMAGVAAVGLYSLGCAVAGLMALAVAAVNAAWTPIFYDLAKNTDDGPRVIARLSTVYAVVLPLLAVTLILFSRYVVELLAPPAYHAAYAVVAPVTVGYLFQGFYFMTGTPLFYARKTSLLPALTGVAAVVNIALNLALVPRFGIMGAGWATLLSWGLLFTLTHRVARGCYAIPYEYGKLARVAVLFAGAYLAGLGLDHLGGWAGVGGRVACWLLFLFALLRSGVLERGTLSAFVRRLGARTPAAA